MINYVLLSYILNNNTPTYGNRDKFKCSETAQIIRGESANSSSWYFSSNHIGTHIDIPKHFFDNAKTITEYSPEKWFFNKIQVVDIPCDQAKIINIEDINCEIYNDIDLLLFRTGYGKYRNTEKYWKDNPGLSPELCFWLRNEFNNLRAVGLDFLSLTSWESRDIGKEAHRVLLDPNGDGLPVWIIEDMNLQLIKNKIREVLVAPLFVKNGNGSPVTVFAKSIK